MSEISRYDLALSFESLGGGSLAADGWGYGCEFGYFQRWCGVEPLGLLRWTSINLFELTGAINCGFEEFETPRYLELVNHQDQHWGYWHSLYRARCDHSGFSPQKLNEAEARKRFVSTLAFLKRKLIADLRSGEKIFVYRYFDDGLSEQLVSELADALRRHNKAAKLLYVYIDEEKPFQARRVSDTLIMAGIDRFAAGMTLQPRQVRVNNGGWELVCRAALNVAAGDGHFFSYATEILQPLRGQIIEGQILDLALPHNDWSAVSMFCAKLVDLGFPPDTWHERVKAAFEQVGVRGKAERVLRAHEQGDRAAVLALCGELLAMGWLQQAWPVDLKLAYGVALRETRRFAEADAVLNPMRDEAPDRQDIAVAYGWIAHQQGQMRKAVEGWGAVIARWPDCVDAYFGQAGAHLALGEPELAEETCRYCLERGHLAAHLLSVYAEIAEGQEHWAAAAARWTVLRDHHPHMGEAYHRGIHALCKAGEVERAAILAGEALAIHPNDPNIRLAWADIPRHQGDEAKTRQRLQVTLDMFPDHMAVQAAVSTHGS